MSKVQEVKKCLCALLDQNLSMSEATNIACDVMLGFYKIYENKEVPNDEQKLELLKLLNNASLKLVDYADRYKNRLYLPSNRDEILTCKLHSGFQYLKDDYLDSSLVNQLEPTAKQSLNKFREFVDYEELQECIEKWVEFSYQPPKPSFVPAKHFWWDQESQSK